MIISNIVPEVSDNDVAEVEILDVPIITFESNDLATVVFDTDEYVSIRNSGDYDFYQGDYVVTPKSSPQVLETEDKIMTEDVSVLAIPYTEVTNESGGYTVSIG